MALGQDRWTDRIADAEDDDTRRRLAAEVGLWRAGRLADVEAMRSATFALSRLYMQLGERDQAVLEARQLLSLVQTPPRASGEDVAAATGWLRTLGADVRDPKAPPARRERGQRAPKQRLSERALAMAERGDWVQARSLLRGKRGPDISAVRRWIDLAEALALDDTELRSAVTRMAQEARAAAEQRVRRGAGRDAEGGRDAPKKAKEAARKTAEKSASTPSDRSASKGPSEPAKASPTKAEAKAAKAAAIAEEKAAAAQRNEALLAALQSEPLPSVEDLVPVVASWPRRWQAIAAAESLNLSDEQAMRLLRAVHASADDDRAIPGGTTLALRMAASGGEGCSAVLADPELQGRYGGPGMDALVPLLTAAVQGGWQLNRVLRGATRRETRDHPVLKTVGGSLGSVWRLLLVQGDAKRELWYIHELPAEGRAGVPMLLLDERDRVIAVAGSGDLLDWCASLDGPVCLAWDGAAADALREALSA